MGMKMHDVMSDACLPSNLITLDMGRNNFWGEMCLRSMPRAVKTIYLADNNIHTIVTRNVGHHVFHVCVARNKGCFIDGGVMQTICGCENEYTDDSGRICTFSTNLDLRDNKITKISDVLGNAFSYLDLRGNPINSVDLTYMNVRQFYPGIKIIVDRDKLDKLSLMRLDAYCKTTKFRAMWKYDVAYLFLKKKGKHRLPWDLCRQLFTVYL
jgi:hypothetical protein